MSYVSKVKVIQYGNLKRQVWISSEAAKSCGLEAGAFSTLNMGPVRAQIQVFVHTRSSSLVLASPDICALIGFYPNLLLLRVSKLEIAFGPFVAVYVFENKEKPPFGPLNPLLRDMFSIADTMGIPLYVLCPGFLTDDHQETLVKGWRYQGGKWLPVQYPKPTFLISKVVITPPNKVSLIDKEMSFLQSIGCQFLSQSLGNKWVMHQTLSTYPELISYLPRTEPLQEPEQVMELVSRFGGVYIKPSQGTQGNSIYRLHSESGQNWKLSFRKDLKEVTMRIPNSRQSIWIQKQIHRPGGFLVQQEIKLLEDQDKCKTDFRWLLQKDGTGKWAVTSRIARTGAPGSTTTNLSTGGQVTQAKSYLEKWADPLKVKSLLKDIDEVTLLCAEKMEKSFGAMGEIGIDIGVDIYFQIWILETNPRPGRKMLKKVSESERTLSLRRPLEYAKYATGFPL